MARIAAPAAFLLGVTVAVVLVRAGMSAGDRGPTVAQTTATTAQTTTGRRTTTAATTPAPVFASVQAGDTLDQIAIANDTTVERLLQLNPGLDPTGLQIGQRIRVR